jgi:hypothetical protein
VREREGFAGCFVATVREREGFAGCFVATVREREGFVTGSIVVAVGGEREGFSARLIGHGVLGGQNIPRGGSIEARLVE